VICGFGSSHIEVRDFQTAEHIIDIVASEVGIYVEVECFVLVVIR